MFSEGEYRRMFSKSLNIVFNLVLYFEETERMGVGNL